MFDFGLVVYQAGSEMDSHFHVENIMNLFSNYDCLGNLKNMNGSNMECPICLQDKELSGA